MNEVTEACKALGIKEPEMDAWILWLRNEYDHAGWWSRKKIEGLRNQFRNWSPNKRMKHFHRTLDFAQDATTTKRQYSWKLQVSVMLEYWALNFPRHLGTNSFVSNIGYASYTVEYAPFGQSEAARKPSPNEENPIHLLLAQQLLLMPERRRSLENLQWKIQVHEHLYKSEGNEEMLAHYRALHLATEELESIDPLRPYYEEANKINDELRQPKCELFGESKEIDYSDIPFFLRTPDPEVQKEVASLDPVLRAIYVELARRLLLERSVGNLREFREVISNEYAMYGGDSANSEMAVKLRTLDGAVKSLQSLEELKPFYHEALSLVRQGAGAA